MNIISNNCIGAHIYRYINTEFNNPFIWMSMLCDDFIELIINFNNINFLNIKTELEINRLGYKSIVINCDNKINIHFIHYIYDEYDIPTKRDKPGSVDILYKNIEQYAIEKWNNRINRMKLLNEEPIFIYSFNYKYKPDTKYYGNLDWYDTELEKLYNASKYAKILIVMHKHSLYEKYIKLENNNFKIVTADNDILYNVDDRLRKLIYDKIKEFK